MAELARRRPVAHGFDVVPVGVEDEGAAVIGVVVRAQAWRAEVQGARRQRRRVDYLMV